MELEWWLRDDENQWYHDQFQQCLPQVQNVMLHVNYNEGLQTDEKNLSSEQVNRCLLK
jgi:hypothetical protein